MIFVLAVMAVFVGVSIYFFFKAEGLQRSLISLKRENKAFNKENKVLVDVMALVASRNEEFLKLRLKQLKEANGEEDGELAMIAPLINNYAAIFRETLKPNGQLKAVCKKCYDTVDPQAFNRFVKHISAQNAHIRKMWSGNNLNGFLSLVESLLHESAKDKVS